MSRVPAAGQKCRPYAALERRSCTHAVVLIDVFRASGAIAVDAGSFLVSALALSLIRTREPALQAPVGRRSIWADIIEGLHTLRHQPDLHPARRE